jgi:hypothetical protein
MGRGEVPAVLRSMVFGSCCESLRKAMHDPPHSLIRVEVDGTLFMDVGYAQTERDGLVRPRGHVLPILWDKAPNP